MRGAAPDIMLIYATKRQAQLLRAVGLLIDLLNSLICTVPQSLDQFTSISERLIEGLPKPFIRRIQRADSGQERKEAKHKDEQPNPELTGLPLLAFLFEHHAGSGDDDRNCNHPEGKHSVNTSPED